MIRQKPNLLLLDEPTNHLDLEMRQALSVALIEYSGALVVISHDRHLLRSVCDELLIVHDGIVDRFNRSLDEYPAWIKEQKVQEVGSDVARTNGENPTHQLSKKQIRQQEAKRRQRLKPMFDKVRAIENKLASARSALETTEEKLADEAIYANPSRQSELTGLVSEQASLKSEIGTLEWGWMEASEALENAE
jgi:ATP-binding cassette subfamily F protein 3